MLRVVSYISAMLFMALPALAQDTGWIGISIEDQKENGAIISRVQPNSPAEKAKLKEGDVILEFNKESVVGAQQLTRLVRETPVGRTVSVRVRREGTFLRYGANTDALAELLGFLYAECCTRTQAVNPREVDWTGRPLQKR